MAIENGFSVCGLQFSPIKGPEGNIEYLIYLCKNENPIIAACVNPEKLVNESHEELL